MQAAHAGLMVQRTAIAIAIAGAGLGTALASSPPGTLIGPTVTASVSGQDGVVASDAAGNYVLVWVEQVPGSDDRAVRAQRYSPQSVPLGPAFTVSAAQASRKNDFQLQHRPHVAMDDEGDFAVTWTEFNGPNGYRRRRDPDVFVRRFSAGGVPVADEVLVGHGTSTSVAMDRDGDAVVTWDSGRQAHVFNGYGYTNVASYTAIHAQRISANGAPSGKAITVDSAISAGILGVGGLHYVTYSSVSLDPAGDFVVAWTNEHTFMRGKHPAAAQSVYARRFGKDDEPLGKVIEVSPAQDGGTTTYPGSTGIACDASGGFVVTWSSTGSYARSFDANGVPRSATVVVATGDDASPSFDEAGLSVVSDAAGDFAVATAGFDSAYPPEGSNRRPTRVRAHFFSANGVERIDPVTIRGGFYGLKANIAMDAAGNLVMVSTIAAEAGTFLGVAAQRFTGP